MMVDISASFAIRFSRTKERVDATLEIAIGQMHLSTYVQKKTTDVTLRMPLGHISDEIIQNGRV